MSSTLALQGTPVPAAARRVHANVVANPYLGSVLLGTLIVPSAAAFLLARLIDAPTENEIIANLLATLAAGLCWAAAGWLFIAKVYGRRFFGVMSAALAIKVVVNFMHFYFVFAPLAGISSAADVPDANFTGDSPKIFLSAVRFYETLADSGLWYAIVGDYYRGINNPGIAIIFGGLFTIFGAFASVAIPWIALYSTFAAAMTGMLGRAIGLSFRQCKVAVLLVLFMPGFFVFPPLYRDNLIIFLLVLTAYTALLLRQTNVWTIGLVLLVQSVLLFSLRSAYLIIPPLFGLAAIYFESETKARFAKRLLLFGVVLGVVIAATWSRLVIYLDLFAGRLGSGLTTDLYSFAILGPFKAIGPVLFYFAAAVFSLLSPMPWWQSAPGVLLSYQVFAYAQTWWGLTVIGATYLAFRRNMLSRQGWMLVLFFLMIFALAVLGSLNFQASYFQIASPFLVLAALPYLMLNWRAPFRSAALVIGLAHIALLTL